MTTEDIKELLEKIEPSLTSVKQCVADSEIDEGHHVSDHYDCVDDLRLIAATIKVACNGKGEGEI